MIESLMERQHDPVAEDEPIRAAIYARTSSTQQRFGHSLEEQVRLAIDRCESLSWDVRFVFRDEAESGKDTNRPMFQEMLTWAERQAFDVVVFWKLDRFSRSLMHAVRLESELRKHDVGLHSVTEQIDTTSAPGRFNFRNIASAAEFERDMIQQRTKMGLNALALERKWPNDSPPIGYEISDSGRLRPLKEEAQLVDEIFERYVQERSMPQVAAHLNEAGVKTSAGGDWTPRAVSDVLRNEIYIGHYEVGDIEAFVEEYQIIDEELFEEVEATRMRFQTEAASQEKMPKSQKEQTVHGIEQSYRDYLQSCC